MGGKNLRTSLADKLKAAGIVSDKAVEKAGKDKQNVDKTAAAERSEAAMRDGTVEGITSVMLERRLDGSFDEVIEWAANWFDALGQAGHSGRLKEEGWVRPGRCHSKQSGSDIAEVGKALGFELPPTIKAFYSTVGGVEWGEYLKTIPLKEIPKHVAQVTETLQSFAEPPAELSAFLDELLVVPLHTVDGNYDFALCNVRDQKNEAMIYFVYHDEAHLYGGCQGILAWLGDKLEEQMTRFAGL